MSKNFHTHMETGGLVTFTTIEGDGDTHIRTCTGPQPDFVKGMDKKSLDWIRADCVIVECIPELPCQRPAVGDHITVRGIARFDGEHKWNEVHPAEQLTIDK